MMTFASFQVHYKIKMFKEQLQKIKSETEIVREGENNVNVDDGTIFVTAIKISVQKIQEEIERERERNKAEGKLIDLDELQRLKRQLNPENLEVIMRCLEQILQRILVLYETYWDFDSG